MLLDKLNETELAFKDIIGDFSVLHDTVFLPKITAFCDLASLKEAEENLALLSTVVFYGKTILTHGTIHEREYLFFYTDKGKFESKRILNNKIDSLSFFASDGFRLIILLSREVKAMLKSKKDIKAFFGAETMKSRKPKMAVIFESEILEKSLLITSIDIYNVFDDIDVIFFLGDDIREIKNKEGTLLLC